MEEKLYVGCNQKVINEVNELVTELCGRLNRIQGVWVSMFPEPLDFAGILALKSNSNPVGYIQEKYFSEHPKFADLREMGLSTEKAATVFSAPADLAKVKDDLKQAVTISGIIQLKLGVVPDQILETGDAGSFSLSESGKELIQERFSFYVTDEKQKELYDQLTKLAEVITWLNDRGANIMMRDVQRIDSALTVIHTGKPGSMLNKSFGAGLNIINYQVAPQFLRTPLADVVLSNS